MHGMPNMVGVGKLKYAVCGWSLKDVLRAHVAVEVDIKPAARIDKGENHPKIFQGDRTLRHIWMGNG